MKLTEIILRVTIKGWIIQYKSYYTLRSKYYNHKVTSLFKDTINNFPNVLFIFINIYYIYNNSTVTLHASTFTQRYITLILVNNQVKLLF